MTQPREQLPPLAKVAALCVDASRFGAKLLPRSSLHPRFVSLLELFSEDDASR